MIMRYRIILTNVAMCALLLPAPQQAAAGRVRGHADNSIPTKGQADLIVAGIVVIGAAIGIGIYVAVRHGSTITGCAASGPDGLVLEDEGDHQSYALMGDVGAVKPGDRVRVSGKKKKARGATHPFLVDKVKRDFGACAHSSSD